METSLHKKKKRNSSCLLHFLIKEKLYCVELKGSTIPDLKPDCSIRALLQCHRIFQLIG